MAKAPCSPELCDKQRIADDTEAARKEFRSRRLGDPLKDYVTMYPTAEAAAKAVIGALNLITALPSNAAVMAGFVGNKAAYSALRSLAATPISADDLNTLLRERVSKKSLMGNQALADGLATLLRDNLDPNRFPWVAANRPATPEELKAARLATAVLTAVSAVQALRRGDERKQLEGRVQDILKAEGFTEVKKPKGGVTARTHLPAAGTYMTHCKLGGNNADFVIGLRDLRILAIECKASNSEVNGFKRLNKEVVGDAKDWIHSYGNSVIVVGAALRGVFKPDNVEAAQNQQVYLFWWHRMQSLEKFLKDAV